MFPREGQDTLPLMLEQLPFPLILADLQLDTQNSCLFTYNTFIKILYMFRALLCSYSGGPPEDEQGNARNM